MRLLYIAIGVFFVGLAFVGIFLPVLPTTPFLLIAVWAFSKGSPRLERWLLQHPKLGPAVRDWRAHRIIPLRAKCLATAMMSASFLYLWFFSDVASRYVAMAGLTMLLGAGYIWSKPHRSPKIRDTYAPQEAVEPRAECHTPAFEGGEGAGEVPASSQLRAHVRTER